MSIKDTKETCSTLLRQLQNGEITLFKFRHEINIIERRLVGKQIELMLNNAPKDVIEQ